MTRAAGYWPVWYEEWLRGALDIAPRGETDPALIAALQAFHDAWATLGSEARDGFAYAPEQVRAYTLFYMSINLGKLWLMLDALGAARPPQLDGDGPLELLDLGCGPGTLTWAWLFYLAERHPQLLARVERVRGIDRSADFLGVAERLAAGLTQRRPFAHIRFEWHRGDWREHLAEPTSILCLGNTLMEQAELPPPAAFAASPADLVTILEPGTREHFHRLLPIRDTFIATGWSIGFPCTSLAACPMADDNWCHFHINRFSLPLVQRMAAKAGRDNPRHHFSGFLFSKATPMPADCWRVMSTLRRQKRSGIRWLCDGEHLVEAIINRRAKSPANRPFFDASVGDILRIDTTDACRQLIRQGRISAGDAVVLLKVP